MMDWLFGRKPQKVTLLESPRMFFSRVAEKFDAKTPDMQAVGFIADAFLAGTKGDTAERQACLAKAMTSLIILARKEQVDFVGLIEREMKDAET